jgi:hypothetical protein
VTVDELREKLAEFPGYHEVTDVHGQPIKEVRERTTSIGAIVVLKP